MRLVAAIGIMLAISACSIIKGAQIENAVLDALAKDQRTAQYEFQVVRQDDGYLVITGKLFKPEEFDIVTEIAKSVPGVEKVLNRCSVEEPGSNLMQDEYVNSPFL